MKCLLVSFQVRPPSVSGHVLNVAQAAFNAIATVVNKISSSVIEMLSSSSNSVHSRHPCEFALASSSPKSELSHHNDRHGRNALLSSYTHYQAHLPHPDFGHPSASTSTGRPKSAPAKGTNANNISLLADDEVGSIIMKGQQRGKEGRMVTCS